MSIEFETQVLDINVDEVLQKLRVLGATEKKEVLSRRWVYDIACLNNEQPGLGEWIRLREAGGKSALTYKNKKGTGISDTTEIEVNVDDFDKAAAIFGKLNCFSGQYYQENKRKQFMLGDLEFDIDYWPNIPPFLEIESGSEERVLAGLKLIGLENSEHGHIGLINIYAKYGINIHDHKELKF